MKVQRNPDDRRVVGDIWSYLGVTTYVPNSVAEKAQEAIAAC